MFLITSIIQYFGFTAFTNTFLLPIKNKLELEKSYEFYKTFHNVMMCLISAYMFLYGFRVYYDVKEITKSDSIYENIYSPVKIETESFKILISCCAPIRGRVLILFSKS